MLIRGDLQGVIKLLQEGASVHVIDTYGWTPLHDASMKGYSEIVQALLMAGAQVNIQDKEDFYTPLHDAVEYEHTSVIALLLKAGANTLLANKEGLTPYRLAEKYNKYKALSVLKDI